MNSNNTHIVPSFIFDNLLNLFAERMKRNMSLFDIAKVTGIKPYTLRKYEFGNSRPGKTGYNKLAEIFGWRLWE